jgi:3-hexulose-6-phosphate synthase
LDLRFRARFQLHGFDFDPDEFLKWCGGAKISLAGMEGTCSDAGMQPTIPYVQLALDFPTIDEALRMAEIGVRAGVDILEAGTPLIVAQGVECIGRLARVFPGHPILADYKTMDSGGKNVLLTQKQGAHYMTVCANAADETVKAAIAAGRQTGIKVVTDMIGVKDIAARASVVAHWGVDMIYLHYAADQRRADGARDSTQWLTTVLEVVDVPVGLATFGAEDAVRAVRGGAQLVAIGHPLFESADVLGALKQYVEEVKANYQPKKRHESR